MATEKNINVFLSSKNKDDNSTNYSYKCIFPNGLITCEEDEYIKMNIMSFNLINTMYNININNNRFSILTTDLSNNNSNITNYSIPFGNYSVLDIRDYVNNNNNFINLTYNKITNKYLFKSRNSSLKIYLQPINSGNYFGYENSSSIFINDTISDNPINVVYNNIIYVRATNLNFELNSLENINTQNIKNNFEISNIILSVSKTDIAPFAEVKYENYDGGNSYCYNLYDKTIDYLNLEIKNEYDEFIYDAGVFSLSIRFSIHKRENNEMLKILNIMNGYLRYIYIYMNIFYSFLLRN